MRERLGQLPESPGVYLFRDGDGQIIYVGKALSLKHRVRSYFSAAADKLPKVRVMMEKARDLEYITTDSEVEALILEANLIKEHRPRYNISLKDDKSYPYLKVTLNETYPRVLVSRRVLKDGARYFGPYTQVGAMNETLRLLKRIFPLRSCKQKEPDVRERPCLNKHIKRCLAPCTGLVDAEEYRQAVDGVLLFLEGKQGRLIREMRSRMEQAAEKLEFELAARLRDQLLAVEKVVEKQKIVNADREDRDVLAMARGQNEVCAMVFFVRGGSLIGREHFILTDTDGMGRDEVLTAFLKQYYLRADFVPREILAEDILAAEQELLEQWLTAKRGARVYLHRPQRGEKKQLVDLVGRNALLVLGEVQAGRESRRGDVQPALEQLAAVLELESPPQRIECYDISNTQGAETVASMVVFEDGKPAPGEYRRFKIETVAGPDDYASLEEALTRRLVRGREERALLDRGQMPGREARFQRLPQLMVIDGGKGQLSQALQVLKAQGFAQIPICSLAEREEEVFVPGRSEPLPLPLGTPALSLLQRLRDEAHRFALRYHRQLRGKRNLKSMLEEIEGIGPARRRELLLHFGTVDKIKEAEPEALQRVKGMNRPAALAVYHYFRD